MEIKVIGSGCASCKRLLQIVQRVDQELSSKATIVYVTDMMAIAQTGIMKTPGLMIDGKIIVSGRVPSPEEVKELMLARMEH